MRTNWQLDQWMYPEDFNELSAAVIAHEQSLSAGRVFVQQADPEITHPDLTGPAVWYVLDGAGKCIGKKVRPA